MASCRRQCLNRDRVAAYQRGAEVADHSTRSFGQSQLDRLVQISRDVAQQARNLQNGYLTDRFLSGVHLPTFGQAAG
jgi:hypothetical protein